MPIISFDVPTGIAGRVADAFIASYPPPEGVPVGTAAQKLAYVRTLLMNHIKAIVQAHEANLAAEAARIAAADTANTDIVLT